jgi:hypothetical protein
MVGVYRIEQQLRTEANATSALLLYVFGDRITPVPIPIDRRVMQEIWPGLVESVVE